MTRPLDLAWEVLVEETKSMPEIERGALNVALKAIKAQCHRDGLHPDEVPAEIKRRAAAYRDNVFQGLTLTPLALAKHWNRCIPKAEKKESLQETYNRIRAERAGELVEEEPVPAEVEGQIRLVWNRGEV